MSQILGDGICRGYCPAKRIGCDDWCDDGCDESVTGHGREEGSNMPNKDHHVEMPITH